MIPVTSVLNFSFELLILALVFPLTLFYLNYIMYSFNFYFTAIRMDQCLFRKKKDVKIQPECTEMTSNTVAQINKNRLTVCEEKRAVKKSKEV